MKTNRTRPSHKARKCRLHTPLGRGRSLRALLGALLTLWTLSVQAQAAAPSLMTYQGRLKESGLPVTGTRNVNIFLCTCLSGACAPACTDTFPGGQSVSVANGLFRTTFTVPSSVDLTTGQWYLEVQIGAVALAPREQITSSPYALYASSASTLVAATGTAGVNISTSLFVIGAGNVGIGTTNPVTKLDVYGDAQFGSGATKSTFTALGDLRLSTGAFLSLSGPTGTITSGSSVTASGFFGSGAGLTGVSDSGKVLKAGDTMTGQLTVGGSSVTVVNTAALDAYSLAVTTAANKSVYHLYVATAGWVGIGTDLNNDPKSVDLSVAKSIAIREVGGSLRLGGLGGAVSWGLQHYIFGATTPDPLLQFVVSGGTRVHINSAGLVGIGTTSPSAQLHVSSANAVAGDSILKVSSGTAAGQELLVVRGDGNVGIGTTNPQRMLTVAAPDATIGFKRAGASVNAGLGYALLSPTGSDDLRIRRFSDPGWTAFIEPLTISSAGNVGIGTTNPSVWFQVGGGTLAVTAGGNVGIGTTNPNPVAVAGWGPVLTVGPSKSNETPVLELYSNMGAVGGAVGAVTFRSQLGGDQRVAQIQANLGGVTDRAHLTFLTSVGAGAVTERMRIEDDGNVGIGTTDPTAKLHISNGATILEGDVAITTGTVGGGSHLRSSQPTNPVAAVSAGCGGAAPAPTVAGTDMAGTVTLNTGAGPTATCTLTFTFVRPYVTAPKAVVITPMGPNVLSGASIQLSPTVTSFVIMTNGPPAASTPYTWSYIVIE